jgi:hypothetical protein
MSKKTTILLGFICLKFIMQYVLISSDYELQRDEYLHLDQANHLAWGYLSVPPVTSWISYLIGLLGNSVFWVKFFPALFGALTILVVWKSIEALHGNLFALVLGATCVLFSVLLRLNTLYQPNSLDVLCWTTLYFILIRYLQSEQAKWLYIGAVVFAIGFLNKYNIVFLALGLLPAILVSSQRSLLLKRHLYLAALLGLLLVLPNLLWQYQHNFPFIYHLRQLSELQLVHVDRLGFLKGQLLFFIGSLFVILAGLYALIRWEPLQKYRLFFWSFFFTLTIFLYFRAKDYYAIGLYPVYLAFGSVFLANSLMAGKKYLQPIAIAIPLLFFIPLYQLAFPNRSPEYIQEHQEQYKALGMLRWEDGKDHPLPQDFADMLGWQELALKVDRVYASLPDPDKTLVLCDNYGQAGAINYYTKKGIRAVSFSADYVDWFKLDQEYLHLIRVINYDEREIEFQETAPWFQASQMADSITNPYARERGTTIVAFVGTKVNINERIEQEIKEVKNYR